MPSSIRAIRKRLWGIFYGNAKMSCKKETEPAISFEETMGFNT